MAESARRGRGGGGAARRAARSAVSFETAKYIERNIPNYEVLTEEALQIIEDTPKELAELEPEEQVQLKAEQQQYCDAEGRLAAAEHKAALIEAAVRDARSGPPQPNIDISPVYGPE